MTYPFPPGVARRREDSFSDGESEESYGSGSHAKPGENEAPAKPTAPSSKGSSSKLETSEKRTEVRRSSVAKAVPALDKEPAGKKTSASASRTDSRTGTDRSTSSYSGTGRKVTGTLTSAGHEKEKVGSSSKGKAAVPNQGVATSPPGPGRAAAGNSTMKAKKTAPKPQPAVNIFTSGKVKKPRQGLAEAMKDPTKEPKLFQKHRYLRLAEKRSRDMEDLPVAFEEVIPVNMNTKVGGRTTSNDAPSPSPSAQSPTALTQPKPAITLRENGPTPAPLKKKRKSVRWVEGDGSDTGFVEEPEPMDIDSPDNSPRAPPRQSKSLSGSGRARLRSPPPPSKDENSSPKKLSLDQYRTKVLVQSIDKELILGSAAPIRVTFNGIPRDPAQTWISDFAAQGPIEFHHTCFSKAILHRLRDLVKTRLSDGTVTPKDDEAILDATSEYLRARLLGLYCTHPNYGIIIFPTRCEEWKDVLPSQEPASPSGVALRYMIFHSPMDYRNFLRPYTGSSSSSVTAPAPAPESTGSSVGPSAGPITARQLMATRLLKLDYAKLLPKSAKLPAAHGFFLAFTQSREATLLAVYHWLRDCNPDCYIYSSRTPGAWEAYRDGVSSKRFRGAVIVHEMLIRALFRFPGLSDQLINEREDFWCLSESLQAQPVYESAELTEGLLSPGGIQFGRLFPARTVIFVTPSFFVSEPQRAFEFLEWFLKYCKSHYYRLVTACNIHQYLLDLAVQKSKEYDDLWARSDKSHTQKELDTNLWGLSKANCAYRYKSAILASELHSMRITNLNLFGIESSGAEDDTSPLHYAPPFFDPNDEQSLVNWFGYWSRTRYDQFRKFHVLGSSAAMKLNQRRTGERRIPVPKYTRGSINDPDLLLERNRRKHEESEQQHAEPNAQSDPRGQGRTRHMPVGPFQSNLIDGEHGISNYLFSMLRKLPRNTWTVYRFPVSWLDTPMGDHFGDFRQTSGFKRIDDWFKFCWRFLEPRFQGTKTQFSTYVGFFYTIVEDWDPDNIPESHAIPRRYPWLLIYRPVNATIQSTVTRCEVIIWDPLAKAKFPGSQRPAEKDLLDMQRRAIRYICENTAEKNEGSYIDQVWLGGFEYPGECESPYPIDKTLNFLRRLAKEPQTWLPELEDQLPAAGYRKVMMEGDDAMDDGMAMDIDSEDSDDEDTVIIFHAPRATLLPPGQRTKCTNKLFEEARLARAHAADGDSVTHILYTFPPTEEWYADQRLEGRSFEHINVKSWESIFNTFKIGASTAVAEGTVTDESGGESPASY